MKTKKIEGTLSLNKKTIANLGSTEMQNIYGADFASRFKTVCLTNCVYCGSATCDCTAVPATCTTSVPNLTC